MNLNLPRSPQLTRRHCLSRLAACAGGIFLPQTGFGRPSAPLIQGQAEHVISIWLGGGMGQIDSFDPKRQGDPSAKRPGSLYPAIDTAVDGVQVCEHLSQLAPLMDRVTAVRTVHHEVIDEHAAATNRMHT
ncbi:MAG: DUF1501 domain-containing protein, partial [Planctomycetales bacterium]|nr:DUF1501 domain-containing protein [Planctomycetales bacterium]